MVIAVLAVIWVVALTPMMLRKLSDRRFSTSVDSFHRQLGGMRRAYPRLAASAADPEMALHMAPAADTGVRAPYAAPSRMPRSEVSERPLRCPAPQSARRRRVLLILVATMLGFFLLGMIPALKVLWGFSLLAFGAAAGYLALLIHIHRRAVERETKVVDIRVRRGEPGVGVPVTAVVPAAVVSAAVVPARRRAPEQVAWADDEWLGPAFEFDYDESVAGTR